MYIYYNGYYGRYVDDIFLFWEDQCNIHKFHKYLNDIDKRIQCTIKMEAQRKINFLGITLERQTTWLVYDIYRKNNNSNTIIPANSHHSIQNKITAFRSTINRVKILPFEKDVHNELNFISKLAINNRFDKKLIEKIYKRHQISKQEVGLEWQTPSRRNLY